MDFLAEHASIIATVSSAVMTVLWGWRGAKIKKILKLAKALASAISDGRVTTQETKTIIKLIKEL